MRYVVFLLIIMVSFISCTKEKKVIECIKDYAPLKVGNYWIYNIYYVNYRGERGLINVDSVVVSQDTIINDKKYYVMEGLGYTGNTRKILNISRDSLNYIVNPAGEILLSTIDFDKILRNKVFVPNPNDTIYTSQFSMRRTAKTIQTLSATYDNTLNYQEAVYSKFIGPGRPNPMLQNSYYAHGVGLVFEDKGSVSSTDSWEKELVRYKRK